jgi:uncharacterized protein YmfQ (DUF2313 family)
MADLNIFDPQPIADQVDLASRHLPVGRVWDRSFDPESNLYKLLLGLSYEFFRIELLYKILAGELDIHQTVELISEWEKSVGLPDECMNIQGTVEERRAQVLQKFTNLGGVQTAEDFKRVAAIFGYDIEVIPAAPGSTFPMIFPFKFWPDGAYAHHTMVVELPEDLADAQVFPYAFPIVFADALPSFIECIFNKLAPANVRVIFKTAEPVVPTSKIRLEVNGARLLLENGQYILLEE